MASFPAPGGYAEYVVADAGAVVPLPESLGFAEATALLGVQGLSAYLLLEGAAGLRSGESVLVNAAAGGVGSLAVQLAKLKGAGTVVGTASTPEKLDLILSLGADAAVNYAEEGWTEGVREATGGRGADVVLLEGSGGEVGEESFGALATFGRLVAYSARGLAGANLPNERVLQPVFRNQSLTRFSVRDFFGRRELIGRAMQELLEYATSKKLRVVAGDALPLIEASQAHRAMAERRTTGKVVLTP